MGERLTAFTNSLGQFGESFSRLAEQRRQDAKDKRLAQAIIDKEVLDNQAAIEEEQRKAIIASTSKYIEGRKIMADAIPGISYPQSSPAISYLGPIVPPAAPAPTPYDYLGGFTTPETPSKEASLSAIPGVMEKVYRGQPTPGYTLAEREMDPYKKQLLETQRIRANRQGSVRGDNLLNSLLKRRQMMSTDLKSYTDQQRQQADAEIRTRMKYLGVTLADLPTPEEVPAEDMGFWAGLGKYIGWGEPAKSAAKPVTQPVTTIRVRIGNQTGTINSDEFDPKTMVKI